MPFKDISFFSYGCHSFQCCLFNFGRGHNEDYFCEIILKFGPVVQMFFKDVSIFSTGSLFVQRSRTAYAILVEGNMRNISVKLFEIWTISGSGDAV